MLICLGENIRTLRTARGLTQEQFGYELGVSGQAVSRWENGITYPDITMLPMIADFFDVSLDELMGRGHALDPQEREAFFKNIRELWDRSAFGEIAEAYDKITVYDTNEKRTGAISLQGIQVVVQPGYYPEHAFKMQTEVEQAEPVISVDKDTGLITVTSEQVGGFVRGGTETVTEQISHDDLKADNIKTGKSIFGIDGTYTKIDGTDGKMPVESRYMVSGFSGFVNGERVDGSATDFKAVEEYIDLYYEENGELKQTTGWNLGEGFVKNVSLVFNDAALLNRLKAI